MNVQRQRIGADRTLVTYDGCAEDVIQAVAEALRSRTRHYEHMFTVQSVRPQPLGKLVVECVHNAYAGD